MREWLVGLVGTEWADKALYLVVAAIVLLLLFSVIWVARKALGGSIGPRSKGRGPRLAVMDVTAIDPKRKLVLIRRDEVEHLLLVGGQNDVVVEAGILRIPASARASRNDAALRSEPDMEDALRQPVARPMAPKAVPAPSRTRQPAAAGDRAAGDRQDLPSQGAESRAASPLTRPVPLPAPAAVERPAAAAASPAKPQPVAGRPAEAPQAASAVRAAPQAPEPARPDEGSGSAPEPAASPRRQEAMLPDAGPSAAPDVRIEPPLLPGSPGPSAPPVSVDQDLRPASDAKAEDPDGIDARQDAPAPVATPQPSPLPRRQTISVTAPAERAQPRPMQRVAIGGSAEPARRALPLPPPPPPPPAPQVLPMASRSMATPTYPARPDVAAVEDQAASASPVTGGEAESRSVVPPFPAPDNAAAATSREVQAPKSAGPASDSSGGTAGLMSPIIAAAQRQQEVIRARSSPLPARTVPPLLDSGGNPLPPFDPGSRDGEEETAEKRPLSVRSFATSIQTRKPSFEPTVPPPLPAPPPPTDSGPGVSAPASDDKPAAGGGGVEDLLSAELDADLAGVNLPIAGPETAKAPEPVPLPDRQPVPAVKADAKEPWALTLEEEMDRLLGDFDFETSGSKKNG